MASPPGLPVIPGIPDVLSNSKVTGCEGTGDAQAGLANACRHLAAHAPTALPVGVRQVV